MGGRYSWSDVRAGWIDARRTDNPRVFAGRKIGAADYAIGYAFGALL